MKFTVHRGAPKEYRHLETGRELFSVSQVRKRMWDGFSRVPADVLEAARVRGKILHYRFARAMFAQVGLCPYPEIIPEYMGHCISMDDWFSKVKPIPHLIEQPSWNPALGIAGCADAKFLYGPKQWLTIGDYKSGDETPTDSAQLIEGYGTMEDYKDARKFLDIYTDKMGGQAREVWRTPNPHDRACFLNALQALKCDEQIMKWRNGRDAERVSCSGSIIS